MSFLTEITALVGTTATSTEVDAAMAAGCADVVRKATLTNPDDLWLFTKTEAVPSGGLSVGSGKVYDVSVGSKPAKIIPPELRYRAAEIDSINYATGEFPVYYLKDGKIKVIPEVASAEDIFGVGVFSGLPEDNGPSTTVNTIGGNAADGVHPFSEGDFAIIKQTNVGGDTHYVGNFRVVEDITSTSFKIDRNHTTVSPSGYTVEKATATATYIATHAPDSTQTDIDNFPSSYYRLPVIYAACSVLLTRMEDIQSGMPTLTIDSTPVLPNLNTQTESLPTYISPSSFSLPPAPASEDIDFTGVGTPPTIDSVEPAVLPVLDFDITDLTINSPVISDAPVAPFAEDGSDGKLDFDTLVRGKVPSYTKAVFSVPAFPSIPTLVLPEPPIVPALDDATDIDFSFAGTAGNQPSITVPVMGQLDFSGVDTFIDTEEDAELASVKLQAIQAKMTEFQSNIAGEQLTFNKDLEIYKSAIQEEMEEAKTKLTKENQDAQQKLATYAQEIQAYQGVVNAKVLEWTKNNIELTYTKWVQDYEKRLAQYQQDMANEMNVFNKQLVEYQSEIAKVTGDATNVLAADNNRFSRKLQSYQGSLEEWKITVNTEITDWQTTVAQVAIAKFTQTRAENLQEWQSECNNELQSWANRIQYSQQKHQADIQQWQALFTKASSTFTAETGFDLAKYTAEVQAGVQKYQSDESLKSSKFKGDLEKYIAEMNSVNALNNSENANYQGELAGYQAKTQSDLAKYTADIQKFGVQYKWFTDKYVLLKQEYSQAFVGQQPQQEGM